MTGVVDIQPTDKPLGRHVEVDACLGTKLVRLTLFDNNKGESYIWKDLTPTGARYLASLLMAGARAINDLPDTKR